MSLAGHTVTKVCVNRTCSDNKGQRQAGYAVTTKVYVTPDMLQQKGYARHAVTTKVYVRPEML